MSPIFTPQAVVYRGTVTGLRVSAVDGTAFIDGANASITALADGNHSIEIYDSSGRFLRGVLKAAGTGETGNEGLADPAFDNVNTPPWTKGEGWAVASGLATGIATNSFIYSSPSPTRVTNSLVKLSVTVDSITGGRLFLSMDGVSGAVITGTGTTTQYATDAGVAGSGWFLSGNLTFSGTVSAGTWMRVLTPSTSGVTIVTAKAGTVFNFGYKNAAFTYNAASYFCVVRRLR